MNTLTSTEYTTFEDTSFSFLSDADKKELAAGKISKFFPALKQTIHGKPIVFLDSAASSLKPQSVIDSISNYYSTMGVNTHRGTYTMSQKATDLFERTRESIRAFINAEQREEIIFTAGTTDAFNLLAESYGKSTLVEGDEVLISEMEHHANILPWQRLVEEKGIILKTIRITPSGEIDMEDYHKQLTPEVKIVSITHVSNVLGTINPVAEMVQAAHKNGSVIALDCAQTMVHGTIDVQATDADFVAFSGHKMFGPTGIGILYGKHRYLDQMPPYRRGGGGILNVTFDETLFRGAPQKFEVGTQHIAGGIGLHSAVEFITAIGPEALIEHDKKLIPYTLERLKEIPDLKLIGNAPSRAAVFSFTLGDLHGHDVGTLLDEEGVAVRVGNHCAQPLAAKYQHQSSIRASFAIYNTLEDVDRFIEALHKAKKVLEA